MGRKGKGKGRGGGGGWEEGRKRMGGGREEDGRTGIQSNRVEDTVRLETECGRRLRGERKKKREKGREQVFIDREVLQDQKS